MAYFKQEANRLIRRFDKEILWIEAWGENSLRVRATMLSEMPDSENALLPAPELQSAANITIDGKTASIQNGNICAKINRSGKITFYNEQGKILLEEYSRRRDDPSEFASALNIDARAFKPILGGDFSLTARFESDPDEKLYGMGQYQQSLLNIKGCVLELAHRNSQASVPFAVSSHGYGFLWNNPAIGKATLGRNITEFTAEYTKLLDYWITAGETPDIILKQYSTVTGTVPMMPDYAMGFWQCKLRYMTQEELLNVAREYKRRGIPISVIVVDFFHWTNQGDWKYDPVYWPDPKAMADELHEMGIKLMVSIWPTVDTTSENYQTMRERGLLVSVERGTPITLESLGNTVFYDATNPEARQFLWEKAKENYVKNGVDLFWLDEAEPEYGVYDFDNYRYHAGTNLQIGNIYPLRYAQTFYDGMTVEGNTNVINLIRCAWAGSQRYGALVWSGDIHSSFRALRNQLAAGLNMAMAGIPWWTTDIGGFHGGNIHDPKFHELFIRWFQYAAFCPVMRLHGHREPFIDALGKEGGGLCGSGAENEIWSYGDKVLEICKRYINIREKLRPYIRQLMEAAHKDGTPVMRPLFYDYPHDAQAWEIDDQYMFGSDILVAPVLHDNTHKRDVYLPEGNWTNPFTKQTYNGGQTICFETTLDDIPVFVRNGDLHECF